MTRLLVLAWPELRVPEADVAPAADAPEAHRLTQFARTDGARVWYPSLVS